MRLSLYIMLHQVLRKVCRPGPPIEPTASPKIPPRIVPMIKTSIFNLIISCWGIATLKREGLSDHTQRFEHGRYSSFAITQIIKLLWFQEKISVPITTNIYYSLFCNFQQTCINGYNNRTHCHQSCPGSGA